MQQERTGWRSDSPEKTRRNHERQPDHLLQGPLCLQVPDRAGRSLRNLVRKDVSLFRIAAIHGGRVSLATAAFRVGVQDRRRARRRQPFGRDGVGQAGQLLLLPNKTQSERVGAQNAEIGERGQIRCAPTPRQIGAACWNIVSEDVRRDGLAHPRQEPAQSILLWWISGPLGVAAA